MFIQDHAPVYPRVKLARYDKLNALHQAAVFLHADAGLDLQQAQSSLLASAALDGQALSDRVAFIHASDPDCTVPAIMVMTLRRPIMWDSLHAPIDYLLVARVPQLTELTVLHSLREQARRVVAASAAWLERWRDDPVALGMFADDVLH